MAKTLIYQLYPLSWQTGFSGMRQHLPHIAALGVDYILLNPIFRSPCDDGGYDVSNYKSINTDIGHIHPFEEFSRLVDTAHEFDIGVLLDPPFNHTSIRHRWFDSHPEYYCWSDTDRPGWHNLFDGGSAWRYSDLDGRYYLHLFHPNQADLNWFPNGQLNEALVEKFQSIFKFWTGRYHVDGFRLDFPQGVNKDVNSDTMDLSELLFGDQAIDVINALFPEGPQRPFLVMECFDPTFGEIVDYYTDNTPIDFVMNVVLKDEISQGEGHLLNLIDRSVRNPRYMLELESHDSPRFPSRGVTPEDMICDLFNSGAEGICLYQGQELGLTNPTPEELPDELMLKLDAQTAMRYIKGESLDELRPLSRSNGRIQLPLQEYERQENDPDSYLNLTKTWINRWRQD